MKEPSKEVNDLSHAFIGAAIKVHRKLGPGFLEAIYENALCVELGLQKIPFANQVEIHIDYKGIEVGIGRIDLLIGKLIVVELKTVEQLHPIHTAQVISYLKATNARLGLLVNFNVPILKDGIKRIVLSSP